MSISDAAHEYVRRGWLPIQLHHPDTSGCSCGRPDCGSIGKHPVNQKWQESTRPSGADVQAMWDRRPDANVGIATGAPSAIWVLDIDPKSGGMETMRSLIDQHGKLPKTYTVQTGSGGYHYYFAMETGLRNTAGRVGPGIDTRADGGQVVAPPSRTPTGSYVVIRDVPVARAPEWLLELVRRPEQAPDDVMASDLPRPEDIPPAEWDRLTSYARRAIDAELARLDNLKAEGWDGAPWDHTTFQVACSLLEFANSPWNAYSVGQAKTDLFTRAPRDPGFDDARVEQKWDSARARIGDKARPIPHTHVSTAEDPLFSGPDVRDPSRGGRGEEPAPATMWSFFTGDKGTEPDVEAMANGVMELGPIGWGRDEAFWSYHDGVWRSDRQVVKRRLTRLLKGKYRQAHAANTGDVVRFRAAKLSGDPVSQYMNFTNGMLDWQTGKLLEHDPSFLSTIQFPVQYNPAAECPTFDGFLADILHPDYVRLAWEMLGYLMYSGNKLQVAFLFYGSGQNGKGTLLRVIETLLGKENIANESLDQLNSSAFSTVNLYGKIANIVGDIDATYQESTARFKALTGEDMIGAERKFGDRFNFENWAVPVFSANEIPGSSDVTDGYLRRWVVLHFRRHIDNPTRGLSSLLATEVEGIAARAVIALRGLMERGAFDLSGEAGKGHQEFAESIDQVRQWIKQGGARPAPGHQQRLDQLYGEYMLWANKTNQGRLREAAFSRRLVSIGFPVLDIAGVAYHDGIKAEPASHTSTASAGFFG